MKCVFLDTNVIIDFLADRAPFAADAEKLFDLANYGRIKIFVSAISYNNIYYVLRRSLPDKTTIRLLDDLAGITEIIDVTGDIIKTSLKSDFKDYEDAIQYYSALSMSEIDLIVTRNTKDFRKSKLAAITPTEAVILLRDI